MPEGTCKESSRWLAEEFPELRYVEGVLVVFEGGRPIEWLQHAWTQTTDGQLADATIRPASDVQWKHIPDGPEHNAHRAAARHALRDFGPPVPFDYDETAGQDAVRRAQAVVDTFYASKEGAVTLATDEATIDFTR
jgi:hypothetical protein